jgi:hypothetical protein
MSRSFVPQDELTIPVESETRIRTIPPTDGDERKLFDEQLKSAEAAQGEAAHALKVAIAGVVGAEPSLRVLLVTAPDGPRAPPEDVWSDPVPLVDLPAASLDSVQRRVAWVLQTTDALGLKPAMIDEIWSFGPHPFRGDAEAIAQLLDARMRLVGLAFESARVTQLDSTTNVVEDDVTELVVQAELTAADTRRERIIVELLRQPKPAQDLVLAVTDWTSRRNTG